MRPWLEIRHPSIQYELSPILLFPKYYQTVELPTHGCHLGPSIMAFKQGILGIHLVWVLGRYIVNSCVFRPMRTNFLSCTSSWRSHTHHTTNITWYEVGTIVEVEEDNDNEFILYVIPTRVWEIQIQAEQHMQQKMVKLTKVCQMRSTHSFFQLAITDMDGQC